jgi:hypothetical protein
MFYSEITLRGYGVVPSDTTNACVYQWYDVSVLPKVLDIARDWVVKHTCSSEADHRKWKIKLDYIQVAAGIHITCESCNQTYQFCDDQIW